MDPIIVTPIANLADELEDVRRELFYARRNLVQVAYARDAALARVNSLERDLYATQEGWRQTAAEAAEYLSRAQRAEQTLAETRVELDLVSGVCDARA